MEMHLYPELQQSKIHENSIIKKKKKKSHFFNLTTLYNKTQTSMEDHISNQPLKTKPNQKSLPGSLSRRCVSYQITIEKKDKKWESGIKDEIERRLTKPSSHLDDSSGQIAVGHDLALPISIDQSWGFRERSERTLSSPRWWAFLIRLLFSAF